MRLFVSPKGLASLILTKLRSENSANKKTLKQAWRRNKGLATLILTKLRFENSANKKTLKQAWRFFLLHYLFVSPEGFEPSTASLEGRCSIHTIDLYTNTCPLNNF